MKQLNWREGELNGIPIERWKRRGLKSSEKAVRTRVRESTHVRNLRRMYERDEMESMRYWRMNEKMTR